MHQRHTATGHDALLYRRPGRRHGVLDAALALLELGLGGRADLDHRYSAGELGQPLLQLLAVPVRVGLLDLATNLRGAGVDVGLIAATLDDGGLVLGHHDAPGLAEHLKPGLGQRQTDLGVDHLCTGDDGEVIHERFTAVTEERRLDSHHWQESCAAR